MTPTSTAVPSRRLGDPTDHGTSSFTAAGVGLHAERQLLRAGQLHLHAQRRHHRDRHVTVACVDDRRWRSNDAATVAEDAGATAIDVLANDTDIEAGRSRSPSDATARHGTVPHRGRTGLTYPPTPTTAARQLHVHAQRRRHRDRDRHRRRQRRRSRRGRRRATIAEDSGAHAIDVLANDTDIDGGPKPIASATQPAHGTVRSPAGARPHLPADGDYCGTDSFTYTLNGGSTATVTSPSPASTTPPVGGR